MKNSNGKILFVKPFEVNSSGNSFAEVWTNIKKVFRGCEGNKYAFLLRSVDKDARYGFVSLSAWDTRLSFTNAVKENTILKYHLSANGSATRPDSSFLFKITDSKSGISGKNEKEYTLLNFIKSGKDENPVIKEYWDEITDIFKMEDALVYSYLCKSDSMNAQFTHLIIIKFISKGFKNLSEHINRENFGLVLPAENILSVYDINLKNNHVFEKSIFRKLNLKSTK